MSGDNLLLRGTDRQAFNSGNIGVVVLGICLLTVVELITKNTPLQSTCARNGYILFCP